MAKYIIHYYYVATEEYSNMDVDTINADSSEEAIEKHISKKYPNGDVMYGPNNSWSVIDFYRGCISAYLEKDRPKGYTKKTW